jgi:ubiquinone/menaquinone biosynthesis C-methylase UbiE
MLPRGLIGRLVLRGMNMGHRSIYDNVARVAKLKPEDDVLDVACGNGFFLRKHASHVNSIAGLDLSELCVQMARKKHRSRVNAGTAEFSQGEACQLPWNDGKFSAVTSMGSFIAFEHPAEALKEMCRVLRPGGRAVIGIEWNAEDGKDHSKEVEQFGMRVWTEEQARAMMEQAGFADVSITYARGLGMPKMMIVAGAKHQP